MSQAPDMRAGDEDRDRTVTLMREAYAEGRLTADEFQQRMAQAQESKTYGELAALVSDLPVLNAVGEPRVVNPDPRLRLRAALQGWPIDIWR